jgi:hypothetical protein
MSKNLIIEFDPTISEGIRQSAEGLGLKAGDFIAVCIGSLLTKLMATDLRYPLSEQLDPESMENCSLQKRLKYTLKLFVAWNKAKRNEPGFELKTQDLRIKLRKYTLLWEGSQLYAG